MNIETADARQEDDRLVSDDSQNLGREDGPENPVQLSPRLCSSYTANDCMSICTPMEIQTSTSFKDFLRQQNPCPPIPSKSDRSPIKRENPPLLRSLAWSQDSQDEFRLAKRRRGDDTSTRSWSLHRRQPSSSPTMVHWEEKIVDPMHLTAVLQRAVRVSSPKR